MNKWKQRYRHWRQLVRLAAAARTLRITTSAAIGKAAQLWDWTRTATRKWWRELSQIVVKPRPDRLVYSAVPDFDTVEVSGFAVNLKCKLRGRGLLMSLGGNKSTEFLVHLCRMADSAERSDLPKKVRKRRPASAARAGVAVTRATESGVGGVGARAWDCVAMSSG